MVECLHGIYDALGLILNAPKKEDGEGGSLICKLSFHFQIQDYGFGRRKTTELKSVQEEGFW